MTVQEIEEKIEKHSKEKERLYNIIRYNDCFLPDEESLLGLYMHEQKEMTYWQGYLDGLSDTKEEKLK